METVRTPDDRFTDLPGYAYQPRYVQVGPGLRMHYAEAGPADGQPVLLLHGQPTWSYLYRTVMPVLAEQGLRAIAPDLIGFGRSDKPVRRTDHSVGAHTRWLTKCIEALDLTGITLFVQDWGGPFGLGALAAAPERFARVVAANTAMHTADPALAGVLQWACHAQPDGTVTVQTAMLDYQRMTQELPEIRPSLFLQAATINDVAPDALAAYDAPFPDEGYCAGARQLTALIGLSPNSECARQNRRTMAALAAFDGPLLTAFSDGDVATAGWDTVLRRAARRVHPPVIITGAGHFLQEDAGPRVGEVIARFVAETPA